MSRERTPVPRIGTVGSVRRRLGSVVVPVAVVVSGALLAGCAKNAPQDTWQPAGSNAGTCHAPQTTATVVSTAGDAALSVADPSSNATGHLVNGAFSLPQALLANAGGPFAAVGGSAAPTLLKTWTAPTSNEVVTVNFKQSIGATDALRTGTYSKTLTFTLSTTTP